MSDELAAIEARLREQGITCFSIRPEKGGVRINYRKDHWRWIPGKKGKDLRDAFVVNGLLDEQKPAPPVGEFEDLLG